MKNIVYSVVLGLSVAGCGVETGDVTGPKGITASELATHIEILSSDAFGGRAPSSPGEEMTINYLANQFRAMGIAPGNGTSYFQDVPLVDITASPDMTMTVKGGGDDLNLAYGPDMVAWTTRVVEQVSLSDSDLVFVGYGIVAPEYGWNDYEGLDMRGKTAVILVNDPGFATQDAALFKGNTMTYYGRWTYKYEEAARQGAAGAIVIHETAPAAYPWDVVESSWTGPQFNMEAKDGHMGRVKVEAWTSSQASRTLFERAGLDYDAETKAASVRGYKAKSLGQNVSIDIKNTIRHSTSKNVLGMIRGSESPDEYFVYMAHWDHLGIDPTKEGDNIYNGALDNATGTAALLELAEAYASADNPPKRSVVFLAVTAEEQGTLGSAYYAANP
ncbi:MAG: M20/M25/M40 family metallo-hydrolase, partial [Sphingomonadales bacterium]|nr:M20/M25/M40 family metallo-hydrolase [Sphingomonadales bacterium]